MRDSKCKICGKDTGQGRRGNTRIKYRGGFRHKDCKPLTTDRNYFKNWYINNRQKIRNYQFNYYRNNKEYFKMWYLINSESPVFRLRL